MKDSLIIVSGGMDSITLLYDKKDEIALGVSFDYGSNHNAREIPYAAEHCRRLGIKHITINLDFIHEYFKSSLLEGAEAIPEGHYADDNMKSTVVPFRNGIMQKYYRLDSKIVKAIPQQRYEYVAKPQPSEIINANQK